MISDDDLSKLRHDLLAAGGGPIEVNGTVAPSYNVALCPNPRAYDFVVCRTADEIRKVIENVEGAPYARRHDEAQVQMKAVVAFLEREARCPIRATNEAPLDHARRVHDAVEARNLLQRLAENY